MMRSTAAEVYPGVSCRNHGPFCFAPAGAYYEMPQPVREPVSTASEQLEALLGYPWPFPGAHGLRRIAV